MIFVNIGFILIDKAINQKGAAPDYGRLLY